MSPAVSIVMPVYNGEQFLCSAVESVLAQTWPEFSLIVVDDGSTDASVEIIEGYGAHDSRIISLHNDANRGPAFAANRAIAVRACDFVGHLDCDDIVEPDWIARQITYMGAHDIDILGVQRTEVIDEDQCTLFKISHPSDPFEIMLRMFVEGALLLTHSGTVYRGSALAKIGGYDPTRRYAVDTDILLRACAAGLRIGNNSEGTVQYRKHDRQISSAHQKVQEMREHEAVRDFMTAILGEEMTTRDGALVRAESYDPSRYIIWDVSEFEITRTYADEETLLRSFELKRRLATDSDFNTHRATLISLAGVFFVF